MILDYEELKICNIQYCKICKFFAEKFNIHFIDINCLEKFIVKFICLNIYKVSDGYIWIFNNNDKILTSNTVYKNKNNAIITCIWVICNFLDDNDIQFIKNTINYDSKRSI